MKYTEENIVGLKVRHKANPLVPRLLFTITEYGYTTPDGTPSNIAKIAMLNLILKGEWIVQTKPDYEIY